MKKIIRIIIPAFLLATCLVSLLWSGTTGKITGIITDKKTGEPIIGANVIVMGTSLGAATDQNGQYTILYVPPGVYNVNISVIGYAKTTLSDVEVHIDQTTRLDVNLEEEAVVGETVVVVAERKIIKRDVATSSVAVSANEIEILPASNVDDVISMQAGIRGNMAIRGSEAEDMLFLVDGITVRDPRNNEPVTKIPLSAVKEISVERGGFNAEYGQVQAGLVNVVTREGDKSNYSGNFQIKYSPPAPKYFRVDGIPDVHDPDSYWMRPYLDDAVCWTGTTQGEPFTDLNGNGKWDTGEDFEDLNSDGSHTFWDQYMRDQYPSFVGWNEISRQLLTDNDPTNDLTPLGAQRVFLYETRKKQVNDMPDYDIDAGFGGPVPLVSEKLGNLRFYTSYRRHRDVLLWAQATPDYVDYDWTMQLTSDISETMKLRISSLLGSISTIAENWNYAYYPHWPNEIANGTGGLLMFNMFSDWVYSKTDIGHRSFAIKLTHTLSSKTFYEVSLENFQRDYHTRPIGLRDTTKTTEAVPGYWVDEYPFGYWPYEVVGITPEIKDGIQASLARDYSNASATTFKADLSSQVNFHNLIKTGVEFVYNDLDLDYGFIQMQTKGQAYASRVQMQNFPIRAAFYIQDKLETDGFTMNAGLRLDYSDSRVEWWDIFSDPFNPYFISSKYKEDLEFDMVKSKPQWQLSPRLGISHPITENSKLFFNYGHFKQMPQYETLFRVQRSSTGSLRAIGDPNLTLAKTISYELGYDHLLFNSVLVQLAAFYKDISDQQNETTYESINNDTYILITSNGYEDIRGFELTLRKSQGRWFTGLINYTYQASSRGYFGRREIYQDPAHQQRYDEETSNLYQERPVPTPYARANLSFYTPDDFGPVILNHPILGGFMLNLLLTWEQGGWTTYNPKNASGVINNVQYLDYYGGTLRAGKTVTSKRFRIQFLVDVNNLFNRMTLWDTGDQKYRESLHLPKSDAYGNIPGDDKLGDYRKPGVEWQPMKYQEIIQGTTPPALNTNTIPIYYEGSTGTYWEIVDNQWIEVSKSKIDQINADKAYIFNPGASTWWFLNPRTVVFGVRLSFDLD